MWLFLPSDTVVLVKVTHFIPLREVRFGLCYFSHAIYKKGNATSTMPRLRPSLTSSAEEARCLLELGEPRVQLDFVKNDPPGLLLLYYNYQNYWWSKWVLSMTIVIPVHLAHSVFNYQFFTSSFHSIHLPGFCVITLHEIIILVYEPVLHVYQDAW